MRAYALIYYLYFVSSESIYGKEIIIDNEGNTEKILGFWKKIKNFGWFSHFRIGIVNIFTIFYFIIVSRVISL